MTQKNGAAPNPGKPFDRFNEFAKKLMAVPKKELAEQEKKYQRRKARKKGRS